MPSGRIFLRRLIDLSTTVPKLSFHITLNSDARADIEWWANYLPTWNGRHRILDPLSTHCNEIEVFTDASGDLGFGIFNRGQWVSEQWPDAFRQRIVLSIECNGKNYTRSLSLVSYGRQISVGNV